MKDTVIEEIEVLITVFLQETVDWETFDMLLNNEEHNQMQLL